MLSSSFQQATAAIMQNTELAAVVDANEAHLDSYVLPALVDGCPTFSEAC